MNGEGQQQSLVTRTIEDLNQRLSRLEELNGGLRGRLEPILEPEGPATERMLEKNPRPEQPCQVAAKLDALVERIQRLGDATQNLLNRLQI